MPPFDSELTRIMRSALDDVMTKVPFEYSTPAMKANELVTAGVEQIQAILSILT
jgi:hypothetical protein